MSSHTDFKFMNGKSIMGMIGEPWDFVSLAGEGLIVGTISDVSDGKDLKEWVKASIKIFFYEGAEISEIVCTSRYSQHGGIVERLLTGESVGLNMFFNKAGKEISYKDVQNCKVVDEDLSFLVGSLKLIG